MENLENCCFDELMVGLPNLMVKSTFMSMDDSERTSDPDIQLRFDSFNLLSLYQFSKRFT